MWGKENNVTRYEWGCLLVLNIFTLYLATLYALTGFLPFSFLLGICPLENHIKFPKLHI